ncbi:uncharacterized protein ARMOST_11890 [Armillaria ostoyae]|uniref:Uncharacterized protein n=1 Tax=Armillaria ostoyae TaxID=47428 RepID=A0A284RIE4_ARMOS|nr:uncharacterized protein ARMOST_11890 [Armillaria ostoyae]
MIEMGVDDHNGIGSVIGNARAASLPTTITVSLSLRAYSRELILRTDLDLRHYLGPRRPSEDKGVTERITVRDGLKETSGDGCSMDPTTFSLK